MTPPSQAVLVQRFPLGAYELTVVGGTCVGERYPANFDVLHIDTTLPLVVVADGMGSGRGSTVAGRRATDTLVDAVRSAGAGATADQLRTAVAEAQARVREAGARLGELTGCTLTALLAEPDVGNGWIVQIGDSRAYRLRNGLLELLTVDHTMAWLGVVNGWYPADSLAAASARYQLTRYVGHPNSPEPDLLNVSLRPGDVYCLCTDGISDQLPYHRLHALLADAKWEPSGVVRTALAETLAAGGRDNATLVIVTVAPPLPVGHAGTVGDTTG